MLADDQGGTPMMTVDENLNEMGFFTPDEFKTMAVQPDVIARRIVKDWPEQFARANGLYLGKYGIKAAH
jgi:hypothetical protein